MPRRFIVSTASPQKVTKIVAANVKEKSDLDGGLIKVQFIIPAFKSQFPIPVRMTREEADMLQVGHDYTIVLEQERLKEGKSGRFLTDFWWGWAGLANPDSEDKPESSPSPADAPQPNHRDATGVSIERQQALIQANLAYWEFVKREPEKKPSTFTESAHLITRAAAMFDLYLKSGNAVPYNESKHDPWTNSATGRVPE
jgi:hypothetical protein